jgi:hypothetical protein
MEPKQRIGKTGTLEIRGLVIDVRILDHRFAYGNHRYLVKPVAGQGQCWTEKVKFDD